VCDETFQDLNRECLRCASLSPNIQITKMRKDARKEKCECGLAFEVETGKVTEYRRAKNLLNAGKHPAFIGRDTVTKNARNGGLLFFLHAGIDCAVAVVNPRRNVLLVLNVIPSHRGHGLGTAAVKYMQCSFVRAIESKVPYFEAIGYTSIGDWKQGRTFKTRIMVKNGLMQLAGRVAALLSRDRASREPETVIRDAR